jgi:hypothetical protein
VLAGEPGPIILGHHNQNGAAVNQVMAGLTGCSIGSRCVVIVRPQVWQAHVEAGLREMGLCAGQHEPGTDEIAVSTAAGQPWEGFHIYSGAGWDDPAQTGTVVWSPGADRPAYAPPGGPVPPTPTPTPPPTVPGAPCPIAPCPDLVWTAATLPDGWSEDEIGTARIQFNSSVYTGRYADNTLVVVHNEPYCASIGMSPMADGQPRASCPMRPDGHPEREAIEHWASGGYVLQAQNGATCVPHPTNPVMFELNGGNCRLCTVRTFKSKTPSHPDEPVCSGWY